MPRYRACQPSGGSSATRWLGAALRFGDGGVERVIGLRDLATQLVNEVAELVVGHASRPETGFGKDKLGGLGSGQQLRRGGDQAGVRRLALSAIGTPDRANGAGLTLNGDAVLTVMPGISPRPRRVLATRFRRARLCVVFHFVAVVCLGRNCL